MTVSLRRRLTATVIAIFVISWLLVAGATTVAARVVLLNELDRVLEGILLVAESVGRPFMSGELQALQSRFSENMIAVDPGRQIDSGTPDDPVQVRLREQMLTSPFGTPSLNVWVGGIQLLVGDHTPAFSGHAEMPVGEPVIQLIDGEEWRVMYRRDEENRIHYAVGIATGRARFDARQLLLRLLLPLALIIPLTVLALYLGIARGLGPLRSLAGALARRRQADSLEALSTARIPEELQPVVAALHELLGRLAATLENEQRFTANAAHELQTPLAAISTEVQLCRRLLGEGEGRDMMARIEERVQRASHSVRQLLVLARLDPQGAIDTAPLDLHALTQEVLSELGHIAAERELVLDFAVPPGHPIRANREALLILLRNLIGNALRYTPRGGGVRIDADARGLRISNDSAPVDDPASLAERFARGPHGEDAPAGTGLGLSIVRRVCELHQFRLHLNWDPEQRRFVVLVGS